MNNLEGPSFLERVFEDCRKFRRYNERVLELNNGNVPNNESVPSLADTRLSV